MFTGCRIVMLCEGFARMSQWGKNDTISTRQDLIQYRICLTLAGQDGQGMNSNVPFNN